MVGVQGTKSPGRGSGDEVLWYGVQGDEVPLVVYLEGKKKVISRLALSIESEPWTALCSMEVPKSARRVPLSAFLGSVAPIRSRFLIKASFPSRAMMKTGPEIMKDTKSLKKGRSL